MFSKFHSFSSVSLGGLAFAKHACEAASETCLTTCHFVPWLVSLNDLLLVWN
jgi:hypothetical protein